MPINVGDILEGKVTGIKPFGAFVSLPERKSGLVHISEISAAYVTDINGVLQLGQTVQVKVLRIEESGKIDLSIKQAQPHEPKPRSFPPREERPAPVERPESPAAPADTKGENEEFEERLRRFMKESDSRVADSLRHEERSRRSGRRR